MSTFKMDLDADKFRRKVGERMKEKIRSELAAAGLANRITITFETDSDGLPSSVNLKGSDKDVTKAKKVLGMK